jgi:hypothetical protein
MRKPFLIFVTTIAVLFANAEVTAVAQDAGWAKLRQLKVESAIADARRAMAKQDFRLLAVWGYTLEVPGTDRAVAELEANYGIRIVEGTADAFEGAEHRRLNEITRIYAAKYNQTILMDLQKGPPN